MEIFITVVHVLVGIFLILVVLLQSGKAGSMGAAFGGSSTGVFGARGANTFLSRVTAGCAVVFFLTSMTLAVMSSKTGSVMKELSTPVPPPAGTDSQLNAPGTAADVPPPAPGGTQSPVEVPPPPATK